MVILIVLAISLIAIDDNGFNGVFGETKLVKFTRDVQYEDFTCSSDQVDFTFEDVESDLQCAMKCSTSSSCFGMFYHPDSKECVGCSFYKTVISPLHSGTVFYRSTDYILITQEFSWSEAVDHCMAIGGRLAQIRSVYQHSFVTNLLDQANNERMVWIGASDTETEASFVWTDGTAVEFADWRVDNPNNFGGNQHCLLLELIHVTEYDTEWKWNDWECPTRVFSLCEFY